MHRLNIVAMVVVLAAGCVPTSYSYTPASSRSFGQRAAGCTFDVVTTPPTETYEEVGVLAHYNGDVPSNLDEFKKVVAKQVCGVGGDAVIASSNGTGYDKGTIIHYPRRVTPSN
jgi:hypothetical protein